MNLEQLKPLIQEHVDLIKVDAKAVSEARERAAKFLTLQAILNNYHLELETDRAKTSTLCEALFSQAVSRAEGKNITEKKLFAADDDEYKEIKVVLDSMTAQSNWVKQYMRMFENAHLMFRQLSRD